MPAVLFAIFVDLLGFGIIVPILPFLVEEYGGTETMGTALFSIYALMAFASGPLWGRLSDRVGRRPALAATFAGAMVSYLILAFADSLMMLFIARAFSGAMAGNVGIAMAAMADLTDENNRGRAMGMIGGVFGLGFAVGPVLGGVLSEMGPGSHVLVPGLTASFLSMTAMLFALRFMSETKSVEEETHPTASKSSFTDFLRTPAQTTMFAMFVVTSAGQSMSFSIMPFWTMKLLDWSQVQVGYLMGSIGLGIAVIQSLAIGPLFKRIGELKALMLGATLHMIGCAVIIFMPPSVTVAMITFPFVMCGLTISFPALNSLLSRRTDRHRQGAAMGLSNGMSALGRVLGPIAGGVMFEQITPGAPFLAIAATGIATFLWGSWEVRRARA